MKHLHGPASYALSFTAYKPLNRFDLTRLSAEERSYVSNRNVALSKLRITYSNRYEDGYQLKVNEENYSATRQRILDWWEKYEQDYTFSGGEVSVSDNF